MVEAIIGLLSDFGDRDYYVSAMKAVIYGINPRALLVDITHKVSSGGIYEGAFLLWQASRSFPRNSIFLGVVDPGVGTERKGIIVESERHIFVGPDNGLLIPAAKRDGILQVREIVNEKYILERSGTFDGRDVFAPVAAHISRGVPLEEFGPPLTTYTEMDLPKAEVKDEEVKGVILHIDDFGNLVSNIPIKEFNDWRRGEDRFLLELHGRERVIILASSYEEMGRELAIIPGSSGFMEFSLRRRSAAEDLGVRVGETIHLRRASHF